MSLDNTFYGFASAAEAKAAWLEQLERVARAHIDAGVIIDSVLPSAPATVQVFATDSASRAALHEAYRALSDGTESSIWWASEDRTWHELRAPLVDDLCAQIVLGIVGYVAACQANWKAKAASIAAAGTADAVLAIDLSAGWPSRTLAGGETGGDDYEIALFRGGVPDASEVLIRHTFARAVSFAANFSGCEWSADAAATASTVITIKLNGASIGSATYGAASDTATVSGVSAFVTAAGDVLTVIAAGTPDATLAGISATLPGRF